MDTETIVKIRGLQSLFNLRVSGYIDKATWEQINSMRWIDEDVNA